MSTASEGPWGATPEDQCRFYETLIEASPTAIAVVDPDLVVTAWNPAAERLFGYTPSEAIGRPSTNWSLGTMRSATKRGR